MLKDKFGFAAHQEKGIYGMSYRLRLTRNTDNAVLNKDKAINNAKIRIDAIEWYVPPYLPCISNQAILSNQILSKTPRDLQYIQRFFFMKDINTQSFWTFELGTQEGINVPIWIIVCFW